MEFARQRSIQSVSMRVPGLESRISSGAVNTLPVTSSVWTESPGAEQNWAMVTRLGAIRLEINTGGDEMLSSVSVFSLFHYSICLAFALIVAGTSLYMTCENIVASFVR